MYVVLSTKTRCFGWWGCDMWSTVSGNCNLDLKKGLNNQPFLPVTVLGFILVDFLLCVESLSSCDMFYFPLPAFFYFPTLFCVHLCLTCSLALAHLWFSFLLWLLFALDSSQTASFSYVANTAIATAAWTVTPQGNTRVEETWKCYLYLL